MANKYAINFPIPSNSNCFQVVWKTTRVMKAAGWTIVSHSDGVTKTAAGTNNNDSWGSNVDPLVDIYPTAFEAAAPWIVMSGPQTLKIPITGNPTGVPQRGETVTQSATSFEGELLGFVWDSIGTSGYMVVMPRVNTPNTSTAIVASTSSASFTPTGTIVTYKREVVFSKSTAASLVLGNIYYVCADASAESASLYSTLATQTGCTAVIQPGGGGTNNGFPAIGIVVRGTGGSAATPASWFGAVTSTFGTLSQLAAVNATPATGVTADGSFYTFLPTTIYNSCVGLGFSRLDDQEPGDVDPYIWITLQGNAFASWSRTSFVGGSGVTWSIPNIVTSSNVAGLVGYQARGITTGSRDVVAPFVGTMTASGVSGTYAQTANIPSIIKNLSNASTATPIINKELVLVYSPGITTGTFKQIKGRCRWLAFTSFGNVFDPFDSKTWFCVCSIGASSLPAIIIGPYDGLNTPIS